jgi:hypothetical protein
MQQWNKRLMCKPAATSEEVGDIWQDFKKTVELEIGKWVFNWVTGSE